MQYILFSKYPKQSQSQTKKTTPLIFRLHFWPPLPPRMEQIGAARVQEKPLVLRAAWNHH